MTQQNVIEGTPAQLAKLLGKLSTRKRYRIVELEEVETTEQTSKSTETSPATDTRNEASIALLRSWLEEDATDDPEEIRKAEEELLEFKRNMNAPRKETGARLHYPEAE